MSDRLTLIMELGALATGAAQRGDDRAAESLRAAAEMLFSDAPRTHEQMQRTSQRGREGYVYYCAAGGDVKIGYSRNPWARTKEMRTARPEIRLIGLEPGDVALERERHAQFARYRLSREWFKLDGDLAEHITIVAVRSDDVATVATAHDAAPQGFSPTPPFPNPSVESIRSAVAADALYAESVENLTGLLSDRVGQHWPDVDGFLKRREYAKWKGWMKEMLTILTGGQAMPADLAQVCRDDAVLERPIGSPKGLRSFVASAVQERKHPVQRGPQGTQKAGTGGRAYMTTLDAIEDL